MTREQVIAWAKEAELHCHIKLTEHGLIIEDLQYFANLVAAAEREACAKVCDDKVEAEYATGKVDHNEMAWTQSCAIDIRARGKK